jgi:hypothetical protein
MIDFFQVNISILTFCRTLFWACEPAALPTELQSF